MGGSVPWVLQDGYLAVRRWMCTSRAHTLLRINKKRPKICVVPWRTDLEKHEYAHCFDGYVPFKKIDVGWLAGKVPKEGYKYSEEERDSRDQGNHRHVRRLCNVVLKKSGADGHEDDACLSEQANQSVNCADTWQKVLFLFTPTQGVICCESSRGTNRVFP